MDQRPFSVTVFCGSHAGADPRHAALARALGAEIARRGWRLVFGGGRTGLMGAVSRGALEAGGRVLGILPEILRDIEPAQSGLTELRRVRTMTERKELLCSEADLFVTLPGGIGTLEETFDALVGHWVGTFDKPLGFLDASGYWEGLFEFLAHTRRQGFLPAEVLGLLTRDGDPARLLDALCARRGEGARLRAALRADAAGRTA